MSLVPIAEWLETTAIAVWVQESLYGFPIVVGCHILGLTLSVGTLVWFDLRLLGVTMRSIPVTELYRRLMPWILTGFIVMFASGGVLFATYATKALENTYFSVKVAALVLAGINALVYHFATERRIAGWDSAPTPPTPARLAGLISILAWGTAIVAGRMMSYTMF